MTIAIFESSVFLSKSRFGYVTTQHALGRQWDSWGLRLGKSMAVYDSVSTLETHTPDNNPSKRLLNMSWATAWRLSRKGSTALRQFCGEGKHGTHHGIRSRDKKRSRNAHFQ